MAREARERAAANREIDPVAREVHELVAGAEVEADLRVAAHEVGEQRREHVTHERDGRGDPDPARGRARDRGLLEAEGRPGAFDVYGFDYGYDVVEFDAEGRIESILMFVHMKGARLT